MDGMENSLALQVCFANSAIQVFGKGLRAKPADVVWPDY